MNYSELEKAVQIWGDRELGKDIHKATASEMFNKPSSEVTEEERKKAKTRNFFIMYSQ